MEALKRRLWAYEADLMVLTEFRPNPAGLQLVKELRSAGYLVTHPAQEARQNSVMVASRLPGSEAVALEGLPACSAHRFALVRAEGLHILGAYFAQGAQKQPQFDFLLDRAPSILGGEGIVAGDLNTGLHYVDEIGKTFSCEESFRALTTTGLIDTWRSRQPNAREYSWLSSHGNPFRLDHVFATPAVDARVQSVAYDQEPRLHGETDHSAMFCLVRI